MVNFDCVISGGPRANIHGCFHNRDVHQNLGPRVHPSQKQLHEEPLEHYGLYRRYIGVSSILSIDYFTVTSVKEKKIIKEKTYKP